jgi:hypothetical protein
MKMKDDLIEALAQFLENGIEGDVESTPDCLVEAGFVERRVTEPSRCPKPDCDARTQKSWEVDEGKAAYEVACKDGCSSEVTIADATSYWFRSSPTLASIADHIGLDVDESNWVDEDLPKYVRGTTTEGVELYLILDPHKYAGTIRDILFDAVDQQTPVVLLTPRSTADEIVHISESYPLGSLVTPLPLELLDDPETVSDLISASRVALEIEELTYEKRGLTGDELARKLSQRPRLVEAQLNYIRVLREDSKRRYTLGAQMETVCKGALMTIGCRLEPEFGGTEARGEAVPDIVFELPHQSVEEHPRELPAVLGIVDAKSGSDADFEDEDIIGKHRNYIQLAKDEPVFNSHDLTHIFIAFDIDGYNEIGWYDGIKSSYRKHTGMIVLHADALLLMVRLAQSGALRNEIEMGLGGFDNFVRPFFQRRLYTDETAFPNIPKITRFDGEAELTTRQEEYVKQYRRRPGLLIVTKEMVRDRIDEAIDREGTEALLKQYGG